MRDFTPEEKGMIINTKITKDCFDLPLEYEETLLEDFIHKIEILRFTCASLDEGDFKDKVFKTLVSMLPSTYKVVQLNQKSTNETEQINKDDKRLEEDNEFVWHHLDWDNPCDVPEPDRLVRVHCRSGDEYICETYLYEPDYDEIGHGSIILQFSELNGDWVDDNLIDSWCYIPRFKDN